LESTIRDDRVLAPTRWTATLIVPVLTAAFVILFLFPTRTQELWAWTIAPTMTSMFMGGGYLAGAWFFARVARARSGHQALAGLVGTSLFATMLLAATILHWDRFNHDHVSFWAWLGLYVATPPLLPWLWARNRRTDPGRLSADDVPVPAPLRTVLALAGSAMLLFALVMFVWPSAVIEHWPWALTPLTARVLAGFLAFPAAAMALFATDVRWSSFQLPAETATIGLALILVATFRAGDEFRGSMVAYAAGLVVALVLLVALQVAMGRRRPARG
jgi:MFS family permease